MDETIQLSMLQSLSKRTTVELPPEVVNWRPEPIEVPTPAGLHGFGPYDTPMVIGTWVATARRWAVPGSPPVAVAAKRYAAALRSPKTWGTVYETWELLQQLRKDESSMLPVPWAWWRLKETPTLSALGVFSPKVLSIPWKRAKFWDEHPATFAARQRLLPKVTSELAELYAVARRTGLVDLAKWCALLEDEQTQRTQIRLRVQQAWTNHNLAPWLADGEELVKELKLSKVAKSK